MRWVLIRGAVDLTGYAALAENNEMLSSIFGDASEEPAAIEPVSLIDPYKIIIMLG